MARRAALAALLAACLGAAWWPAAAGAELWRRPPQAALRPSEATSAEQQVSQALSRSGAALAQQFLRTSRGGPGHQQPYDVPLIECPPASDGMERFACPTQDYRGRYRCIDDHMLCDGYRACPGGEDEDRKNCMFYKTTKTHLNVLADALLRWARGR